MRIMYRGELCKSLIVFSANFLDLAPQYGGITLGISNTIATLPGVFIPSITGHIVQNSVMPNITCEFIHQSEISAFMDIYFDFSWFRNGG